ncbi:gluconate 2-dehydrogenase subunit 3 family protein [Rudaea sp.]|uniref:gluconate 2-dehydrogenase subunit 3 family protein n=1 Tax=Rudaea sp. TaxID=2136325 RepID=UPI0032208974
MSGDLFSRRQFLQSAAGAAWLAAAWPAILTAAEQGHAARATGTFKHLAADEAADFAAIAAQIIPSGDDLPGANEAGVVYFIDAALGGFMAGAAADLRKGLADLNQSAGVRFATLPADRQVQALKGAEATPFFEAVRFLTIGGMFALPGYGGNRDSAGWKLLGFEHQMAWAPPFGFYDAKAGGAS